MKKYSIWLLLILSASTSQILAASNEFDGASQLNAIKQAVFEQKLTAADGAAEARYGISVALWEDVAMIGADFDDEVAVDAGAVYVYTFDGGSWVFQQKLMASDADQGDGFGGSISLQGDRVVIGSPLDNSPAGDSGSAYVFQYNGSAWLEQQKLTASDAGGSDYFGRYLDLDGDRIMITALGDDDAGTDAGAAYVFDFNGSSWQQTTKLTASDGITGDGFGFSVSLDGDQALVGAMLSDQAGTSSGKAYVFEFNGSAWTEVQKLTASDGAAQALFGASVDLLDNRAVIGANRDSGNTTASGSAYVFEHNGTVWTESQKLNVSGIPTGGNFGVDVSLLGNRILIGANRDDEAVTLPSGSVYMFDYDGSTWQQSDVLLANDAAWDDQFGFAVSHSSGRIIAGAFKDDDQGDQSGSAYVFNTSFTVSVIVNGLEGGQSLTLLNNGIDSLQVSSNGWSTFNEQLFSNEVYQVTVDTQPVSPNKTCTAVNGNGTVTNDLVVVTVNCVTNQYPIMANISGLAPTNTLVISQGQDNYPVTANGQLTLTQLDDGSAYSFSITQQPNTPNQTCVFTTAAAGTITGGAVQLGIECVINQYFIGGELSGLAVGNQVVLQNNATDDLSLNNNGAFSFSQSLDDQTGYAVTVLSQPLTPNQSCAVTNDSGQLSGDDVIDIQVLCTTLEYSIAVEVLGLLPGNWLVLQNNGEDDLIVTSDGDYVFKTQVEDFQNYQVTLFMEAQNPIQPCMIQNAQGQVQGEDVHDVLLVCELGDDLIYRDGFEDAPAIGVLD
ncbi:MAG: FG-GAP repeat protein [Xanthomonadales bacterium]|nr:FG-GAP repeat protein [Xanthomonadales bacterium]